MVVPDAGLEYTSSHTPNDWETTVRAAMIASLIPIDIVHIENPTINDGVSIERKVLAATLRMLALGGVEVLGADRSNWNAAADTIDRALWSEVSARAATSIKNTSTHTADAGSSRSRHMLRGEGGGGQGSSGGRDHTRMRKTSPAGGSTCQSDVDGCDCEPSAPTGLKADISLDHLLDERRHFYHAAIVFTVVGNEHVNNSDGERSGKLTGTQASTPSNLL